MPLECLATTDRQTSPARVEDHRSHLDCGAQLRLALPQSALKQGLRVRRAELRNAYRNCLNPPFAQPPCSDMSDFSNTPLEAVLKVLARSEEHTSELQSRQYLV